ncbi:hypothetical protein [Rhodococcus spongiicola]|uniref:hypothetical protein n=1 Tax=Rhodococcus spongiicola TaxID=2487352 RepID=UPI000FDD9FD0|nr:hypothetical protein [Rhodococcus spongiicola]
MIKSLRAAATTVLAAPLLATVFAAPASAAPEDVTLTAEFHGNDVEVTFTNDSSEVVRCQWDVRNDGEGWGRGYSLVNVDPGGEHRPMDTFDDGSYQLDWLCYNPDSGEQWGTEGRIQTAESILFTLPFVPDDDADDGSLGDLNPGILVGILGALGAGSLALGSS